jgi:hypothetical protein
VEGCHWNVSPFRIKICEILVNLPQNLWWSGPGQGHPSCRSTRGYIAPWTWTHLDTNTQARTVRHSHQQLDTADTVTHSQAQLTQLPACPVCLPACHTVTFNRLTVSPCDRLTVTTVCVSRETVGLWFPCFSPGNSFPGFPGFRVSGFPCVPGFRAGCVRVVVRVSVI